MNTAEPSPTRSSMRDHSPDEIAILVIDNEPEWIRIWKEALKENRYYVEFAKTADEALNWLERVDFDLVVINLLLRDEFSDGWLTDCTCVLDEIVSRESIAIIVTGANRKDMNVMYRLLELQRHYGDKIDNIVFKEGIATFELRNVIQQVLISRIGYAVVPIQPRGKRLPPIRLTDAQRRRMFGIATCVLQGIIEAIANSLTLDRRLQDIAEQIGEWFDQQVGLSTDPSLQRTWYNFRVAPEANRNSMISSVMSLNSQEEWVLHRHTRQLIQEMEQRRFADLFPLLTSQRYTYPQVERICTLMDPGHSGLGRKPSKQDMAQWLVEMARSREKNRRELIYIMLETNPIALLVPSP